MGESRRRTALLAAGAGGLLTRLRALDPMLALVYPALYPLRGNDSPYITAARHPVPVFTTTDRPRPEQLWYLPTAALRRQVPAGIAGLLHSCVSARGPMPADCPDDLGERSAIGHDFTITDQPRLAPVRPRADHLSPRSRVRTAAVLHD